MDGLHNESALLANCYKNSWALAEINNVQSIAFSCINTGIYSFPHKLAAEIAVQTVLKQQSLLRITFCCFLESDLAIYQGLLVDSVGWMIMAFFVADNSGNGCLILLLHVAFLWCVFSSKRMVYYVST